MLVKQNNKNKIKNYAKLFNLVREEHPIGSWGLLFLKSVHECQKSMRQP